MSEFGRTPKINDRYGRDHWSKAWSVALAGCGIKGGAVVGKTNANGTAVTEREVNGGHLFHTYFRALGLDPTKNYYPQDRPDADGRPEGRRDRGGAGMTPSAAMPPAIDPLQARIGQRVEAHQPADRLPLRPGRPLRLRRRRRTTSRPALGTRHRQEDVRARRPQELGAGHSAFAAEGS